MTAHANDTSARGSDEVGGIERPAPPTTPDRAGSLVAEWVSRPDNTARSVLVTIFGDTILPVSTGVWLAQLFRLTDVFGFSHRLVRTSMYRLASEGWLTSERSGRQSRYELTGPAREESDEASGRIYRSTHPDWAGTWCLVFLDAPHLDVGLRDRFRRHLGWHGFTTFGRSVLASPATSTARARELCRLVDPAVRVPMGTFEFSDLDDVVADGFFDTTLALTELTEAYAGFVDFHDRVERVATRDELDGSAAFAMRTMLIHDLRRIRLRSADLPAELLPADWAGTVADELAGRLYPLLGRLAAAWLSDVLDVTYPTSISGRFGAAS